MIVFGGALKTQVHFQKNKHEKILILTANPTDTSKLRSLNKFNLYKSMEDNKLPEQHNIKTEGGNYNERIGRSYIQAGTVNYYEQNGCDTKKNIEQNQLSKKQVERLVITVDGMNFEEFLGDKEIQDAVKLILQKASGDTSINFEKIEEGSIKITLDGSPEGLKRLADLIQSGKLGELRELEKLGLSIEDAKLIFKDATEENENAEDYEEYSSDTDFTQKSVSKEFSLYDISMNEQIIIRTLYRRELYGLAIQEHIKKASNNEIDLNPGSLYPALRRLEKKGLVKCRWGEQIPKARRGARRKYYALTCEGEKMFREIENFVDRLRNNRPVHKLN